MASETWKIHGIMETNCGEGRRDDEDCAGDAGIRKRQRAETKDIGDMTDRVMPAHIGTLDCGGQQCCLVCRIGVKGDPSNGNNVSP